MAWRRLGYNETMIAHDYTFNVILEPKDEAGGFAVHVPALPGCHTEGDTRDEAIAMAQDAIAPLLNHCRFYSRTSRATFLETLFFLNLSAR
jgi:predicted RNase H-like HicB family nuclease